MLQKQNSETQFRIRIEELEEENRQLREAMGCSPSVEFIDRCKRIFGLPPSRAKMLALLMSGQVRSTEGLWLAYCDPLKERPDIHVVTTIVCYLRASLRPFEVDIENVWGQGYVIRPEGVERLAGLLFYEAVAA